MKKILTAFLLVGGSLAAVQAHAATTIVGLANTGTDVGGVDANWKFNGGNAFSTVSNSFPVGTNWLNNNAISAWITPFDNQAISLDPSSPGNYIYTLGFNLTGFNPTTASFLGRLLVDNRVSSITLNGHTIFSGLTGGFGGNDWFAFGANGGFVHGMNTLQITAVNLPQASGNPTGLRVEFLESAVSAVPEPATWAFMIAGFGLTGAAMRRRKQVVKTSVSYA